MKRRTSLIRLLLATAATAGTLLGAAGAARAQDFPNRPIKFVVPFAPGSGTDTSARYFGRKLTEMTGQPWWWRTSPAPTASSPCRQVLSAPADGYTVFVGSNSTLAVNVALFKQLPYDPQVDFAPLIDDDARARGGGGAAAARPTRRCAELVAAAKAQPGKLNHGGGSAGYQLMNEAFKERAGVDIVNVPFKGASDALTAVASRHGGPGVRGHHGVHRAGQGRQGARPGRRLGPPRHGAARTCRTWPKPACQATAPTSGSARWCRRRRRSAETRQAGGPAGADRAPAGDPRVLRETGRGDHEGRRRRDAPVPGAGDRAVEAPGHQGRSVQQE